MCSCCFEKRKVCPFLVIISILLNKILLIFYLLLFIYDFFVYFPENQDMENIEELENYLKQLILGNWFTYVMSFICCCYGLRWFNKKNRTNFITYYRFTQTSSLIVIMNCLITVLCCLGSNF